ncbi:MAG: flagellar M-ring protein FliF [Candidatus Margulisbacteria bacterium]|nr:flagellar M-ring protein FliF [Candidatus Margulisiibacteriota bacterium]
MAEEAAGAAAPKTIGTPPVKRGGVGNRLIYIAGGVVILVVILLLSIFFRPSLENVSQGAGAAKYIPVFTHLELKDAAEIKAALEAQGIRDYKIEDNGRTISVRRKDADNVRLAMALEGLPAGGVVGYEIFDKGGALGATDFDKRIKLTRALNGELSRNISRIYGIEEARVQIVIPEKQLFETQKVPVTSAVFIRITKGVLLAPLQIRGIVHLVASSVEELATANVTVVDYSGRILSSADYETFYNNWKAQQEKSLTLETDKKTGKLITLKEEAAKTMAKEIEKGKASLTPQERMEARLRFKQKFEAEMEQKTQSVLDQFFPKGASLIKINAELKTFEETEADDQSAIARLTSIILLDEKNKTLVLTPEVKEAVFKAVAAVTGYVRGRDRIDLRWAPIYMLGETPTLKGKFGEKEQAKVSRLIILGDNLFSKFIFYGILLAILF